MELSKNELAVMEVIWKSDKGATVNAISEVVNEISMPTLHRVVSDLLEKNAIEVSGVERIGRTYARVFTALFSEEDYAINSVSSITKKYKFSVDKFISALFDHDEINEESIEQLEAIIAKRRAKE